MAKIVRYENMRLECADNGFILSYDEVRGIGKSQTWSYCQKKVYEYEGVMEAVSAMKAMKMNQYTPEDSEESDDNETSLMKM